MPYVDVLMQRQIASGRDVDARVAELLRGPLAWSTVLARVESWRALIAEDVADDPIGGETGFENGVANDLLYLHMRWSNALGAEVADCAALEDGAVLARRTAGCGTGAASTQTPRASASTSPHSTTAPDCLRTRPAMSPSPYPRV